MNYDEAGAKVRELLKEADLKCGIKTERESEIFKIAYVVGCQVGEIDFRARLQDLNPNTVFVEKHPE